MAARKFYISSFNGKSGICKYSSDFYRLVLKDLGYFHVDSTLSFAEILSKVSSRDETLIEVGSLQTKEVQVLMRMLKVGYRNISVTLHDPPLIKFPYFNTGIPGMEKISKFYDVHWNNFSRMIPHVAKIKNIYVLSKRGRTVVRSKYHVNNVFYLPHVVDPAEISPASTGRDLFFMGFVGPNKGLDYALKVHTEIISDPAWSDRWFHVVGDALGKGASYFEGIKRRYADRVSYHGYVQDEDVDSVLENARYAVLPFRDYSFYFPFSGSVLQAMKRGKLVFTSEANTVNEMITHGKTGFILSGNAKQDADLVKKVMADDALCSQVVARARELLLDHFSPKNARDHFLLRNLKDTPGVFPGSHY